MGIQYVSRSDSGGVFRGEVGGGGEVTVIPAAGGQKISFNIRQFEVDSYRRDGTNLEITLADGRVVILEGYFDDAGAAQSRLFISADGYINEVTLVEGADGALYAQYGPTEMWSKWPPSDDLIFLDSAEVIALASEAGEETVSMIGAGLLGGSGFLGAAGVGAAGLAASSVLAGGDEDNDEGGSGSVPGAGGGSGGNARSGDDRIEPSVKGSGQIGIGDDGSSTITFTGEAEPGSDVTVQIGDETVETVAGDDGTWEAVFEVDDFPADGDYDVTVTVNEPDGTQTQLDGPQTTIDTTPPETDVQGGTASVDHVVNHDDYDNGVTISGTGEAGGSVTVTIGTAVEETVVDENGEWSVDFQPGDLPDGDYDAEVTIVASDTAGNTTTITDTISVDTIHPELTINATAIGDNGVLNGDAARDEGLVVTGTSDPGATVLVTIADQSRHVLTGDDGTWEAEFDPYALPDTEYDARIDATTQDAAGNVSTASETIRVDLEVRNFTREGDVGGDDNVISQSEIEDGFTLNGTVEPGSVVTLLFRDATVEADVDQNGNWTASFSGTQIPPGTYVSDVTITARDTADNVKILTRSVEVDTEAGMLTLDADGIGDNGVINFETYENGVMVTGTADPFATVEVDLDGVPYTVQADDTGAWRQFYDTADLTPGLHDPVVRATIADDHGNSKTIDSTLHVDTRVDDLAMTPPQIATTTDGRSVINDGIASEGFEITGTVEPGSIVWVVIDGVRRQASVDDDGNWTATFGPNAIQGGQRNADLVVEVEDPVGNVTQINETVYIDTVVQNMTQGEITGAVQGVANLAAAQGGLELTGTAEAGSQVDVAIFGETYSTVSDADGNWSVTIPQADVPLQETTANGTITVTDVAGNTDSIPASVTIDMVAPGQPAIVGYFRQGSGYRYLTTETGDDAVTIHEIEAGGAVNELDLYADEDAFLGETNHIFLNDSGQPQSIPDGSQLIVTTTDGAQNTSSTYVVLDEVNTSIVDPANPNLAGFQIETIDLRFGDNSELTITEEQLLALSDNSNTLTVEGGADDTVTITGAQKVDGGTNEPAGYDFYTLGQDATIIVGDDIDIVT